MFLKKLVSQQQKTFFRCPKITTVRDKFGDVAVDKTVSGRGEMY